MCVLFEKSTTLDHLCVPQENAYPYLTITGLINTKTFHCKAIGID